MRKIMLVASLLTLGACTSTKPQVALFDGQRGIGTINQVPSAEVHFAGKDGMGPEVMYTHIQGNGQKDEIFLGERGAFAVNDKFSTYLGTGTCMTVEDASLAIIQVGHYTSAGVEYAINNNLSMILDYRYVIWGESGSILGGTLSLGMGWQF